MDEDIYYAKLKFLTTYCSSCLDSCMKDKLMMLLFKESLYYTAIKLGFDEDAEKYKTEILNLLNLRTCDCTTTGCKNCSNGYCELCEGK